MTRLVHYYHIYADGRWKDPLNGHITALTESGLLDALDFLGVGVVGSDDNRTEVKEVLPSKFNVVAEAEGGWEQVTHTPLAENVKKPSKILYAHTKGAANSRHDQNNWRKEMTDGVVYHWRECVDLLNQYDAVGCRWRRNPWRHYSGTFWWATSSYLSTLAPISYVYRDDAEAWIGQSIRGGTHVEIDPSQSDLNVTFHPFGRTFVASRTISGFSCSTLPDLSQPLIGDEFIGFSPMDGTKIISYLMTNGATCSIVGNTIIVESV